MYVCICIHEEKCTVAGTRRTTGSTHRSQTDFAMVDASVRNPNNANTAQHKLRWMEGKNRDKIKWHRIHYKLDTHSRLT